MRTLTPNICRRSGSLNRKGMLETCSRLGCCFSVGSEGWSCWLAVCAASSACCGENLSCKVVLQNVGPAIPCTLCGFAHFLYTVWVHSSPLP